MSYAQLGNYRFRISPSSVVFPFEVDSVVIPTVGGRVVQVYGVTLGDMIVQGFFGQERMRGTGSLDSWELAEDFQVAIGRMVQEQSQQPTGGQLAGYDSTQMHKPFRFIYNDDTPDRRAAGLPIHNWDFQVYIKALQDLSSPDFTVAHETGKFSYGYTLTLFIVEDNSRILRQVAVDKFIARLAEGVGWKRTEYNGPMSIAELEKFVQANSPDGTIHGLILKKFQESSSGNTIPGGSATVDRANEILGNRGTGGGISGSGSAGVNGTGSGA
jgi:hypothetical protein